MIPVRSLRPEEIFAAGVEALRRGAFHTAVEEFSECIHLMPDSPEAHLNLAVAYKTIGNYANALLACGRAVEIRPDWPEGHYEVGNIALAAGDLSSAVAGLERALTLRPAWPDALNSLGVTYVALGRIQEALHAYDRAIEYAPGWERPYLNRGVAHHLLGRDERAIADFRQAIRYRPDLAEAHSNLSLLLLRRGHFAEGWREFEWGYRSTDQSIQAPGRQQPIWLGDRHPRRTLLLTCLCGYGDVIQFIRLAPLVREAFQGRVLVECQKTLSDLVATSHGIDGVVSPGEPCVADFQLPIMAMPTRVQEVAADTDTPFPHVVFPYVFPRELRHAAASLVETGSDHLRVGIVWRGDGRRSVERFLTPGDFGPLAGVDGVQVLSLQFDETPQERQICERAGIGPLASNLGDFAQTAAIVLRLDLVITVDTAMAHLAGALGIPVWVLLAERADWRWMIDREDTPWYPTMRLFRQQAGEERSASIDRARTALAAFVELPRSSRPLRQRKLHRFEIGDIPLLAYDELESETAYHVAAELIRDVYGLNDISFRPGDVVIDIGGHIGLVSAYLAKRWPFLRIYTFEPYASNYENCADNLRLNGVANVRLDRRAVTSDGRRLMLRASANTGGATAVFDMPDSSASAAADSTTLDAIVNEVLAPNERCRLLKIDCEGMEYEILQHSRVLDRVDYFAAEIHELPLNSGNVPSKANARALMQHCASVFPAERMRIVHCAKQD